VAVTGGCYCFLFEMKTVKRSAQCHVFAQSPPGRRPDDKYPVTLRTVRDVSTCFTRSVILYFGSNGNSYTVYTQSVMFIYTHILHSVEALVGQNKHLGQQ
jgi:hypothetical protein